jgi:hypothetical protein
MKNLNFIFKTLHQSIIFMLISTFFINISFSKSSKVLDFEDEVIEGVNKKPLDSLKMLTDKQKKKSNNTLYRKRQGFSYEIKETVMEARFVR